jgi:hypothetical protein
MITRLGLALLAIAAPLSASLAQKTDVADPKGVLPNLDIATIAPLVKETGAAAEIKKGDDGNSYLLGAFGETKLLFYTSSCASGETGCKGLEIGASINRDNFKLDDVEILKRVNAFNDRYVAGKAIVGNNGDLAVTRYVIADHGIERGNLAVEIGIMVDMVDNFFSTMEAEGAP